MMSQRFNEKLRAQSYEESWQLMKPFSRSTNRCNDRFRKPRNEFINIFNAFKIGFTVCYNCVFMCDRNQADDPKRHTVYVWVTREYIITSTRMCEHRSKNHLQKDRADRIQNSCYYRDTAHRLPARSGRSSRTRGLPLMFSDIAAF